VSDTAKALKANRLARIAVPALGWSSAIKPPGTVNAAANATVAIKTDPIVPVFDKLSSSLDVFSSTGSSFARRYEIPSILKWALDHTRGKNAR
jgi:hypothetical protein